MNKSLAALISISFSFATPAMAEDGKTPTFGAENASLMQLAELRLPTARADKDKDKDKAEGDAEQVTYELTGDVKKGKKVFRKCRSCHVADSDKNKVGPTLQGVIGRQIASVEGFGYSKTFQEADLIWTPENLTEFLTKPKKFLKGTKMVFPGLRKEADIENVLAYLQSEAE